MLRRTETSLSFPKLLIEQSVEKTLAEERQKAFTYQLVMGALRRRGALDWALGKVCDVPLDGLTPWIRNILRMGLYQILYLDRVPKSAAVDESVKLAKKYGHAGTAGLVNAVLRNAKREELAQAIDSLGEERIADISVKYSHPPWLVELVVEEWGREGAIEILRSNNAIPPLTARVNTLRTTRERLLQELKGGGVRANPLAQAEEGIELKDAPSPSSLDAFKRGLLYFQDAASMLAARCLAVEPGQKVLDVCAGPGGKATHLAALMGNSGKIHALDLYDHRVALIEENAGRLGANIIEARKQDATGDLAAYHGGMDRVIADVPCSGIGVIRRRLDLKWRLKPERIRELARLQSEILEKAAQCVRPGGILLYCTCTITRKENDETVRAFLGGHSEFKLDPRLPDCVEKYLTKEGWVRIMPGDENMDGFFIARFERL